MAVSLAACGSAKESGDKTKESGAAKGDAITVGLLLPENQTARYEKFDKPLIEKKVADLTGGKAKVVYANAKQDATTQNSQVDTMITNKVDVLIVDAVDAKAIAGFGQEGQGRRRSRSSPTTASPKARSTPTPPSTTKRSARSRARRCSTRWATRPRTARSS